MTLTVQERADRQLSEREFHGLVVDLAHMTGWLDLHVRPARTEHGWRVPVSGALAAGWPDLVLVNPQRRRTLAVELKREKGYGLTADQEYVHRMLREAGWTVCVWRPSDMSSGEIQAELSQYRTKRPVR